jgi:hypothetical protein
MKRILVNVGFLRHELDEVSQGVRSSQEVKNDFALSLAHEAVHLEQPRLAADTKEQNAPEEGRAWWAVNMNAVRPMRAQGQPMGVNFIKVDDLLRNVCNDDINCPAFKQFMISLSPGE